MRIAWSGPVEGTRDTHEQVALSDVRAAEVIGRLVYRPEVFHANAMVPVQTFNGPKSRLATLLEVLACRTQENDQHFSRIAPPGPHAVILGQPLMRLNGPIFCLQLNETAACILAMRTQAVLLPSRLQATKALDSDLPELAKRWRPAPHDNWPFKAMLDEITALDIPALKSG
jgi:hypothetical protein